MGWKVMHQSFEFAAPMGPGIAGHCRAEVT